MIKEETTLRTLDLMIKKLSGGLVALDEARKDIFLGKVTPNTINSLNAYLDENKNIVEVLKAIKIMVSLKIYQEVDK